MSPKLPLLALAIAAAFGCGSGRYANAPMPAELAGTAPAGGTQTTSAGAEAPEAPGDPTLTIVNAGAEPRAQVRYHPAAGVSQEAHVTLQMGMGQGGRTQTSVIVVGAKRTVNDVGADGTVHRTFRLTRIELGPEAEASGAKELLKGIDAMGAKETVSDRGITREMSIEGPPEATAIARSTADEIHQALEETTAIFPKAPIGIGAKWDVTSAVTKRGIKVTRVTHYALVAREGDMATVSITTSSTAPPQSMPLEGLPPGNTAELTQLTSEGTGESKLDLTKPFPLDSSVKTQSTMELIVTQQGQKQPVTMRIDVAVKLAAK